MSENNNPNKSTGNRISLSSVISASGTSHCPATNDGNIDNAVKKIKEEQKELMDFFEQQNKQNKNTISILDSPSSVSRKKPRHESPDPKSPPNAAIKDTKDAIEAKEEQWDELSCLSYHTTHEKKVAADSSEEDEGNKTPSPTKDSPQKIQVSFTHCIYAGTLSQILPQIIRRHSGMKCVVTVARKIKSASTRSLVHTVNQWLKCRGFLLLLR